MQGPVLLYRSHIHEAGAVSNLHSQPTFTFFSFPCYSFVWLGTLGALICVVGMLEMQKWREVQHPLLTSPRHSKPPGRNIGIDQNPCTLSPTVTANQGKKFFKNEPRKYCQWAIQKDTGECGCYKNFFVNVRGGGLLFSDGQI